MSARMFVTGAVVLATAMITHGQVAINEVDYQNPSTNHNEWVELVGAAGTDLSGWSLNMINQLGTPYNTVPLSGAIPNDFTSLWGGAGGFFVIGVFDDASTAAFGSPDLTPDGWDTNELQNGPDDVIQLLDPSGLVVDEWEYDDSDLVSVTGLSEPFDAFDDDGISGDVTTYSSIGRVGYSFEAPLFVFDVPHGVGSSANDPYDHQNNSADFWAATPLGPVTEATGAEIYWSGTSSFAADRGQTPGTFNHAFYEAGSQDRYTINIVPEPASGLMIGVVFICTVMSRRSWSRWF